MIKLASFKIFIFIMSLIASSNLLACHRIYPSDNLNSYSSIFLGTVTEIHINDYESNQVDQKNISESKSYKYGDILDMVTITDGSTPVEITAVPSKVLQGNPDISIRIQTVGCTAPLPTLQESGLFFVSPEGDSAVTVWKSDSQTYNYWVNRLGLDDGR